MLNRFSKLPKVEIKDTQVLPDLDIYANVIARKQKQYDDTAETAAKFKSQVSGLQGYGDAAKNYLAKVDEDVKGAIGELSSTDLGSPEARNKLAGLVNTISSDKNIQSIQKANELRANFEKQSSELAAKGKLIPAQQYFMEKAWKNYSKSGNIEDLSPVTQPLVEGVDGFGERSKYFKDLRASGGDAIKYLSDGTAFKNSSKGVSGSRINQQAQGILRDYMNSQVGRQDSLEYDMLVDSKQLDPNKTSKEQYLSNLLLNTGKTYEYSESSTNMDVALRDKQGRDLKKKEEEGTETSYLPAMKGKELKFPVDSNGDAIVSWDDHIVSWFTGEDATSEEKKQFNETISKNAQAAGMSKKEYTDFLQKDPNVKVNLWTDTKKIDSESKRFFNPKTGGGDFFTRTLYSQEYPNGISAAEYMDEKGISEKELKDGFSVIGYTTEDNPYTVRGKVSRINGEQVIIDDSHNSKDPLASHRFQANQAKFNGEGVSEVREFNPADGKQYIFTYRADPSGAVVLEDRKVSE